MNKKSFFAKRSELQKVDVLDIYIEKNAKKVFYKIKEYKMQKTKTPKYYWKSNTRLPRKNKLVSVSISDYDYRKKCRKEQRQQLWIDLVKYIISIPQQNLTLFYAYMYDKKNSKFCIQEDHNCTC